MAVNIFIIPAEQNIFVIERKEEVKYFFGLIGLRYCELSGVLNMIIFSYMVK